MANQPIIESTPKTATTGTEAVEATEAQKKFALWLIGVCHTFNHLQYSINSVLFPVMMKDLGFGYLQLGVLSAASNLTGQGLEAFCGFLTGFFKRTALLGAGNVLMGLTTMIHSLIGSYPQLLVARVASSVGSSPQHPLGASVLSRYFPKARGWALTFHHSAGSVGSFAGPALVSFFLLYLEWRVIYVIMGLPTLLFGMFLFKLNDSNPGGDTRGGAKQRLLASWNLYLKCLKNRNILFTSLVLMVGAAGRGTGINATYLVPFFMERFQVTASVGGLLLTLLQGAGLFGPLAIGWLSDRWGRRAPFVQVTLLFSAIMTVWLANQNALGPLFYLNLILYGAVVQARGSLTQAMVGDFATEETTDAAFSIFYFVGFVSGPIWTLIIGYIMDQYGFTPAFYVAASTYLVGMLLLRFVRE
jgi:MFS family permease